jgi:hypothetical protein
LWRVLDAQLLVQGSRFMVDTSAWRLEGLGFTFRPLLSLFGFHGSWRRLRFESSWFMVPGEGSRIMVDASAWRFGGEVSQSGLFLHFPVLTVLGVELMVQV